MFFEPNKSVRIYMIIAVLSACIIYGQTYFHDFGLDDHLVTQLNDKVAEGASAIPEILTSNYIDVDGRLADYRPLAQVTFALEQSLFGANPRVSHLINLGIYVLVLLVLSRTLRQLLPEKNQCLIGLTLVLFAVHPIHTEVVASLKNREELLAALFTLSSWNLALRHSRNTNLFWLVTSVILFILALMSKIGAAPFALIIPLSIWYFKKGVANQTVISGAAFTLGTIAFFTSIWAFLPWEDRVYQFIEKPIAFMSDPADKWSAILCSIGYYFKLAIWPFPQSIYYGFDTIPSGWNTWQSWVSLGSVIAVFATTAWSILKRSILGFGLVLFVIAMIPISNIFYPIAGTVVERGLFLPSIGISIVIGLILSRLIDSTRFKIVGWSLVTTIILGFSSLSYSRAQVWESFETLVKTDLEHYPRSAKLHQLLGSHYMELAKKTDQAQGMQLAQNAASHFGTSLEINDDWAWLNKQLALTYAQFLAQPEMAIPYFRRELELKPGNFTSSFNLAKCFAQINEPDSSLKYTELTLNNNPTHFPSLRQISRSYLLNQDTLLGLHYLRKMEHLYPESEEPYLILAEFRFLEGDSAKAISALERAVEINPKNTQSLKFLFEFHYANGNPEKAEYYRDVASMN
jgi:hypothetical protein